MRLGDADAIFAKRPSDEELNLPRSATWSSSDFPDETGAIMSSTPDAAPRVGARLNERPRPSAPGSRRTEALAPHSSKPEASGKTRRDPGSGKIV